MKVPIAKILKPWGVRGALKVQLYHPASAIFSASSLFFVEADLRSSALDLKMLFPVSLDASANASTLSGQRQWVQIGCSFIRSLRRDQGLYAVQFEKIDTPLKASALQGMDLFVDASVLPDTEKDEYYLFQMVGLNVYTHDLQCLGQVVDTVYYGASDLLVVRRSLDPLSNSDQIEAGKKAKSRVNSEEQSEWMIPFVSDWISEIVVSEKKIVLKPVEGLW